MTDITADLATWSASATSELLQTQNADGGWPYHLGQTSSTEPTALALLALASVEPDNQSLPSAVNWLLARQREDGLFTASPTHEDASWLTPLAAIALTQQGQTSASQAAANTLLSAQVYTFASLSLANVYNYDTSIPGWPWTGGDFSFVEPTSLAMVFLKQNGQGAAERVRQGADYLRSRVLPTRGGWNYGEPKVLGKEMFTIVQPTALALLALADEQDANTEAGVSWLGEQRGQISSLLTAGWAAVALNVLGELDDDWRVEVINLWSNSPAERRDVMSTSLCLLGLLDSGDHPFAVS